MALSWSGVIQYGPTLGNAFGYRRWGSKLNSTLISSNGVLMLDRLTQGFLSPPQACPKACCLDELQLKCAAQLTAGPGQAGSRHWGHYIADPNLILLLF